MVVATSAERLRIDSAGRLLLGDETEGEVTADDLTISTSVKMHNHTKWHLKYMEIFISLTELLAIQVSIEALLDTFIPMTLWIFGRMLSIGCVSIALVIYNPTDTVNIWIQGATVQVTLPSVKSN